ncbi:hypothetical protein VNO80_19322 [Phaseolus coccineus]|uniref:Uncharacterized protein n=1 Tax=Phaseolus coccineus TaxID=3886 RepID=A0AAN9R0I9_PHACN
MERVLLMKWCQRISSGRTDSSVLDDVTMDSTAFSMHYRSLARSDSGDIKTRQFDVTTPNSHSRGSYMELTERKWCGVVLDAHSAGKDSNDMSIEGEHQRSSEYDILLPPEDAAILAQGVVPNDSPQRSLEGSIASPLVTQFHQTQPSDSSIKNQKLPCETAIEEMMQRLAFQLCLVRVILQQYSPRSVLSYIGHSQ